MSRSDGWDGGEFIGCLGAIGCFVVVMLGGTTVVFAAVKFIKWAWS